MPQKQNNLFKPVLSAMFLALALVLPLVTGQLTQTGNAFCPMHIPVILCGYFCGPWYALTVGLVAPLLRFAIFSMPPLMPIGISMCFELAAYGLISGLMYKLLPKRKVHIYVSLIAAMLGGRAVWGISRAVLSGFQKTDFGFSLFIAGAFTNAVPGIIIQIILIPAVVMAVDKAITHQQKKSSD